MPARNRLFSILGAVALLVGALLRAPVADAAVGGFAVTAAAHVARSNHSATLLPSGRVFVAGGEPAGAQTAEVYDPATDSWTLVAPPPYRFRAHTATLLSGSRVLLVGGLDAFNGSSAHAAIYDGIANAWTVLPDLAGARTGHTATALPDGRVVIIGLDVNYQPETPSIEILNPQTLQWAMAPPLAYPRSNHTATLLPSGKIFVAGGYNTGITPVVSEIFDVAAYSWTSAPGMSTPRKSHAAALLPSGKVLVAGGAPAVSSFVPLDSAEIYDPQTATWSPAGTMAHARYGHAAISLPNGDVVFLMGSPFSTTVVDVFSASAGAFLLPPDSMFGHVDGAATLLASGRVFAFGGQGGTYFGRTNVGETFDRLAASHRVTLTLGDYAQTPAPAGVHDIVAGSSLSIPYALYPEHAIAASGTCGGSAAAGVYVSPPIGADCSIELQFPFILHTISVTSGEHGTVTPSTPLFVTNAEMTTYLVTPDPQHMSVLDSDCDHVTAFGNPRGPVSVTVSGVTHDCTLGATFPIVQIHVSTQAAAGGTIMPASLTVDIGTAPAFTVTPDPGYVVTWISDNCGTNSPSILHTPDPVPWATGALNNDCTIDAIFTRVHTVTGQVGTGGTIAPTAPVTVDDGDKAFFTISHQPGYFISGISGNCGGGFSPVQAWTDDVHGDCTLKVEVEYNTLWRPAGTHPALQGHTATLLQSGQVLVAGGSSNGIPAQLYDPGANAWMPTGALLTTRVLHSAALLPSGKVLIVAGTQPGSPVRLASAELYDPATGAFTAAASLAVTRYAATATLLPSGKVLVTGGVHDNAASASVELYDPATNTWSERASMIAGRAYHAAALLPSGEVLVAGDGFGSAGATSEIYDPMANAWRPGPAMAAARTAFTLTPLSSGQILAASGIRNFNQPSCDASAELFDPGTESWLPAGSLVSGRREHATIALPSGAAIVIGGGDCQGGMLSLVEMYFPAQNAWIPIGRLSDARTGHTATVLADGRVLVAGGIGYLAPAQGAEIMDPSLLVPKCELDVDHDGREDALTDGLLIQRYLAGLRGNALIQGVLGADAQAGADAIAAALALRDFDVDGDGAVDPATDGVLALRYLLRFRGQALIDQALGPAAIRRTPERVAARLASGCIAY